MTLDEIRELIHLAAETKVAELEVQKGDDRVRIRLSVPVEHYNAAPIYHPVTMGSTGPAGFGVRAERRAARRSATPSVGQSASSAGARCFGCGSPGCPSRESLDKCAPESAR